MKNKVKDTLNVFVFFLFVYFMKIHKELTASVSFLFVRVMEIHTEPTASFDVFTRVCSMIIKSLSGLGLDHGHGHSHGLGLYHGSAGRRNLMKLEAGTPTRRLVLPCWCHHHR